MRNLAATKRELKARGITQRRIAREVIRLFPDRSCTPQMVNHVLNGRAKSSYVAVAVESLLAKKVSAA